MIAETGLICPLICSTRRTVRAPFAPAIIAFLRPGSVGDSIGNSFVVRAKTARILSFTAYHHPKAFSLAGYESLSDRLYPQTHLILCLILLTGKWIAAALWTVYLWTVYLWRITQYLAHALLQKSDPIALSRWP
jgi:hypothetical protein